MALALAAMFQRASYELESLPPLPKSKGAVLYVSYDAPAELLLNCAFRRRFCFAGSDYKSRAEHSWMDIAFVGQWKINMQIIVRLAISGIALFCIANISPLLMDWQQGTADAIWDGTLDRATLSPQACSAVLMRRGDVQKELQLDEGQRMQINRQLVDFDASNVATAGLLNGPEGLERMFKLVRAKKFISDATFDKRVVEILNSDQLNRLHQLEIQTEGLKSFLRPDLQSELNLSKRQLAALADLPIGAFGRFAMANDREQGLDALREILTYQQFETWMTIRGTEFSFEDGGDIHYGPIAIDAKLAPKTLSQSAEYSNGH